MLIWMLFSSLSNNSESYNNKIKFNWIDFVSEFMVLIVKSACLNRLIIIVANHHHFYISSSSSRSIIIICGGDLYSHETAKTTKQTTKRPNTCTYTFTRIPSKSNVNFQFELWSFVLWHQMSIRFWIYACNILAVWWLVSICPYVCVTKHSKSLAIIRPI